ncbi:MAG: FKBP-type peptidyl-prolyl cis-trans isomerase [Lachnospiraceae bacterium]|nr:FKBP-type peptidyl-prolyl cis-trans isomerase [Lachnospiraceae bacterium]
MKKREYLLIIACVCTLFWGGSEMIAAAEEETEAERPTYTALDYVILGEYKGMTVQVEPQSEVTDDDVLDEATKLVSNSDAVEWLAEGTVQEGDYVDITYVGTMDGEEFEGGSGDYILQIGSGSFIEGFEEGLIGVVVGDTVDLELTFPEDYYGLAGQNVVFTVTVNALLPELSDNVVNAATDGEYVGKESFLTYVRECLEEEAEENWEDEVSDVIYEKLSSISEITEYPQELMDYEVNQWVSNNYYPGFLTQNSDEVIENSLGMTKDKFIEQVEAVLQPSIQQELLLMAVAESEGIEISEEEYQDGLEQYAEFYGFDSPDVLETYYTETELNRYFLMDKVCDFLKENAVIEILYETEIE